MGCNYYIHKTTCEHCQRSDDPIHIGKSSCGWTFSFRGYRDDWEIGRTIQSESESEWREFIAESAEAGAIIKDECGDVVTPEQFWKMVDAKRSADRNNATYCRMSHPDHAARNLWLAKNGNSFCGCEFS